MRYSLWEKARKQQANSELRQAIKLPLSPQSCGNQHLNDFSYKSHKFRVMG